MLFPSHDSHTPKIHYIGSPFQQDWGEAGQAKRVAILDTDTLTVNWVPLEGYPEYRHVSYAEFCALPEDTAEHRYRVRLTSHAESEQFFQHPRFNRAIAEYAYEETPAAAEKEDSADWSFEGICRRYLKHYPPSKVGVALNEEEMIAIAHAIIGR